MQILRLAGIPAISIPLAARTSPQAGPRVPAGLALVDRRAAIDASDGTHGPGTSTPAVTP